MKVDAAFPMTGELDTRKAAAAAAPGAAKKPAGKFDDMEDDIPF